MKAQSPGPSPSALTPSLLLPQVPSSSRHETLQRIIAVLEDEAAPRLATLLEADIQQAMGQLMSELLAEPLSERQLVDRLESCFSVDRRLAGLQPLEQGQEVRGVRRGGWCRMCGVCVLAGLKPLEGAQEVRGRGVCWMMRGVQEVAVHVVGGGCRMGAEQM